MTFASLPHLTICSLPHLVKSSWLTIMTCTDSPLVPDGSLRPSTLTHKRISNCRLMCMHLGYDLLLHSHLGLEFDATDLIAESHCHFNFPPAEYFDSAVCQS